MHDLNGLKVCFLAGTLGQGGAERQLYYMLRALKERGAEPRVLSLTEGEYWEHRIKEIGVPVTWVGQSRSRLRRLRAIIRELRREPALILQSQHFYTNIYAAAAARVLGIREIGAIRSDAISEVDANSARLGWMSLRTPRAIAANSLQAIENAVKLGSKRSRLHFLPNVVDISQFTTAENHQSDTVRVLTIGRMVRPKRLDRFLRVLATVQQASFVRTCGIIVGDGPDRSHLEADAKSLGLGPEAVEFCGLRSDVARFYHDADVFLLTSDWEGTPNTVLEAMASGLPVVATRVGGLSALVRHGENGYLVDPNDEAGLAEAVLDLVQNRAKRILFGERSRELVKEEHDLRKLADEFSELYNDVLEGCSTKASRDETQDVPRSLARRLLVITSVVHYYSEGNLFAYGPYAFELNIWAKLFPNIVLAAPCRTAAPPGDALPLASNIAIAAQPEMGGTSLLAKARQIVMLPYAIGRLVAATSGVDAIHVRCPGNLGLLGLLISPLIRRKRIAKFAGQWSWFDGESWTVGLQRKLLRSRWWNAPVTVYTDKSNEPDHVIPFFASSLTKSQMVEATLSASARETCPPSHVLYAGRLSAAKNVHVLLDAIAAVGAENSALRCTIVGEGPVRSALENQAAALGISDRVIFAGGVPPGEVFTFYKSADILVLASQTEGWPKTLTEGMAFGLVCIGSNRGLTKKILGEGRGLVVTPGDSLSLASALRRAGQMSPDALRTMRAKAAGWAGQYSADRFAESLEQLLKDRWNARSQVKARHSVQRYNAGGASRLGVMHVTDTLDIGGAERMAVGLVNLLPRDRFEPHLCTTRRSGLLADVVAGDVNQLSLNRRSTFDIRAMWRLVRYVRTHDIRILHAHGTAVFVSAAASLFAPYPAVVWHIHYGRHAAQRSAGWQYRAIRARIGWSIAVSEALARWAINVIGMPSKCVSYVPNFSVPSRLEGPIDLPGQKGSRIVCVANFLPEKDHLNLVDAMSRVVQVRPDAHLLLVGGGEDSQWGRVVLAQVERVGLKKNVSFLGQRRDVVAILKGSDIGALGSKIEGLPLALIEYGEQSLPVVVTSVGQCPDVVDHGKAGLVVQPCNSVELADAILRLLGSPSDRAEMGRALHERVSTLFNAVSSVDSVHGIYDRLFPDGKRSSTRSHDLDVVIAREITSSPMWPDTATDWGKKHVPVHSQQAGDRHLVENYD